MTFRIHPLHSAERHATRMRELGVAGYHEWVADKRGTGRSTALALKYISDAIANPGRGVSLVDHDHPFVGQKSHTKLFAEFVRSYVLILGLKHMHVHCESGYWFLTFVNKE